MTTWIGASSRAASKSPSSRPGVIRNRHARTTADQQRPEEHVCSTNVGRKPVNMDQAYVGNGEDTSGGRMPPPVKSTVLDVVAFSAVATPGSLWLLAETHHVVSRAIVENRRICACSASGSSTWVAMAAAMAFTSSGPLANLVRVVVVGAVLEVFRPSQPSRPSVLPRGRDGVDRTPSTQCARDGDRREPCWTRYARACGPSQASTVSDSRPLASGHCEPHCRGISMAHARNAARWEASGTGQVP